MRKGIILILALIGAAALLAAPTAVPGGCDIPASYGRLVVYTQERSGWTLVFEAEDGTLRFVTWARCELVAVAQRTSGPLPVGRVGK